MSKNYITLLCATALVSVCSIAKAGNLHAAVTEADPVAELSQLATFAGITGSGAYSFTPTWSEELGFAASGALGYTLSERSAVGLLATAGQRQREVLLNFGLAIDAERQIVFSGGQLQEKLEFGTDGAQEWVKQAEYGVAYDARNYSLSLYHVNSESTNNFVGAKSTGAEVNGTAELSSLASLNYAAGYQSLDWDDGSEGENGLTARLGLDYQAAPDVMLDVFADHNVSENQFGIGAQWKVGSGTLSAQYTRIDGNVGSISDDNRVALTLSLPLGGTNSTGTAITRAATGANGDGGAVVASRSSLLADVMRRPDYLPQRVIVKAGQCYRVTSASYGFYDNVIAGINTEFGSQARFVDWTEIRAFGYTDEELSEFLDGAGLTDGMEAWVTNGGNELAAWDVRWQVLNSAGSNPSGYYAVMDQLNSYELTLGRWNTPKRALAYVCD